MTCEYCDGTGELHLLGPNYTTCVCQDNNGTEINLDNWNVITWVPTTRNASIQVEDQICCFPQATGKFIVARSLENAKGQATTWDFSCQSMCEDCDGTIGTLEREKIEKIASRLNRRDVFELDKRFSESFD